MKFFATILISTAHAWWYNGHLIVSRIAYDILQDKSPEVLDKVDSILSVLKKSDPSYTDDEGKYHVVECSTFADKIKELEKHGIEVEILGEQEMEKRGMGSLLGAGQGSVKESKLGIMKWMGGKKDDAPVALCGKGVCFDTGGISLKPGPGMENMRGDMGGAAAVAGTISALAKRKAKANVVGIVGLVENMPDANAQRPGDIVDAVEHVVNLLLLGQQVIQLCLQVRAVGG